MVICFECSRATKGQLDRLLSSGTYSDYSDVIATAVYNLNVLSSAVADNKQLIFGSGGPPQVATGTAENTQRTESAGQDRLVDKEQYSRSVSNVSENASVIDVPSVFRFVQASPPNGLSPFPDDDRITSDRIAVQQWIFGMYNKLLPLKVSCRALCNIITQDYPHGIPLGSEAISVASRIATQAGVLCKSLRMLDTKYSTKREEALSTGFPAEPDEGNRGKRRYANQFVLSINTNNELNGLPFEYKFLNFTGGDRKLLHMTSSGWDFAGLDNPVLDGVQEYPTQKFTANEVEFLLKHIRIHVPAERQAFETIIHMIKKGDNTRTRLNQALLEYSKSIGGGDIRESTVSTQRAGALARMSDLGLIRRIRKGIAVEYRVTEQALRFVSGGGDGIEPSGEGS